MSKDMHFNAIQPSPLIRFLKSGKKYNTDVYQYVLHNGFLPKHANEILHALQGLGKLSVLADDGQQVRKRAFYVNYESYKQGSKKAFFVIN